MRTSILLIAIIVITLGVCAIRHPREKESYWAWMSTKVDEADALQGPEVKAMIEEINKQIPLVTVSRWDSNQVRRSGEYFSKIR